MISKEDVDNFIMQSGRSFQEWERRIDYNRDTHEKINASNLKRLFLENGVKSYCKNEVVAIGIPVTIAFKGNTRKTKGEVGITDSVKNVFFHEIEGFLAINCKDPRRVKWYVCQNECFGSVFAEKFGYKNTWGLDYEIAGFFVKRKEIRLQEIKNDTSVIFSFCNGSSLRGIISMDEDGDFYICNNAGIQDYDINLSNGDKKGCSHSLFIGKISEEELTRAKVRIVRIDN